MRILLAGATGAIGRPLIRCLREGGHTVFGMARSPESARVLAEAGAGAVTADVLEAAAVRAAIARVQPHVVINQLTSLPAHYTPAEMNAAAERDRKVKIEGNANLLAALNDAGVRRYILQSSGFWYAPGTSLADESAPFALEASPAVAAGARTYAELEASASQTTGIECVALRYGFFYGPGTWYSSEGDMGDQVRQQWVPIIGTGEGVWSWVHIEDAAAVTWRHSNAPRVRTTSWTATRRRSANGCQRLLAQSAHRGRPASQSNKHWTHLARTPSTTRCGCEAPRTKRRDASCNSVLAASSGSSEGLDSKRAARYIALISGRHLAPKGFTQYSQFR
jgi:2-alkyl-3-oxoalkanoate reductase